MQLRAKHEPIFLLLATALHNSKISQRPIWWVCQLCCWWVKTGPVLNNIGFQKITSCLYFPFLLRKNLVWSHSPDLLRLAQTCSDTRLAQKETSMVPFTRLAHLHTASPHFSGAASLRCNYVHLDHLSSILCWKESTI